MRCESHASVFVYAQVAHLALAGALRVRVHASASTREFSLLGGGGVESALSGYGENTFGRLGERAGARLRGRGEVRRERGGSEGTESLVARRL